MALVAACTLELHGPALASYKARWNWATRALAEGSYLYSGFRNTEVGYAYLICQLLKGLQNNLIFQLQESVRFGDYPTCML